MAYNPPLQSLISSSGALGHTNRSSTSLLTPQLALLADPPFQHKVDLQLVHFVTHEVRLLLRPSCHRDRELTPAFSLQTARLRPPRVDPGSAVATRRAGPTG
jgi:hypothetical protein